MRSAFRVMRPIVLLLALLCAPAAGAEPAGRVLYHKPLAGGRELVVIQDPAVPVSTFADLSPLKGNRAPTEACCLSMELRSPAQPPLRLWSQIAGVRASEYEQYAVLDMLVLPNRILMVMAAPGGVIVVRQVGIFSESRTVWLVGDLPWSLISGTIPNRPGRLGAKLSLDEQQNRVELEVTDTLQGVRQHTRYEQRTPEQDFVQGKQWQEKVP